jgi:hypothetical protein
MMMIISNVVLWFSMSEVKDDLENTGEGMKRGAKKTGHMMEEGAEEAKDKVD